MQKIGVGVPLEDAVKTLEAREHLINLLYRAPKLTAATTGQGCHRRGPFVLALHRV